MMSFDAPACDLFNVSFPSPHGKQPGRGHRLKPTAQRPSRPAQFAGCWWREESLAASSQRNWIISRILEVLECRRRLPAADAPAATSRRQCCQTAEVCLRARRCAPKSDLRITWLSAIRQLGVARGSIGAPPIDAPPGQGLPTTVLSGLNVMQHQPILAPMRVFRSNADRPEHVGAAPHHVLPGWGERLPVHLAVPPRVTPW